MSVQSTTRRVGFPAHLMSTDEGNYHAPWRDQAPWPGRSMLKVYEPPPDACSSDLDEHASSVILYLGPGVRVTTATKRLFHQYVAKALPDRVEIEFSSPACGLSTPSAFKSSAVEWALGECDEVLIAVDHERGLATGEAHRVLALKQVVFRCREREVDVWVGYLKPRLKGRHRLTVIHLAAGRA
ncbi:MULTISPECIES: hypothetical protein [unclassified Bradyrhizobium]|uniref:hypothetical protein n=1 Tax=unclassified Bradyrhizobium TaxID=2631580 RepID=UPI0023057127|nr:MULTISPECIES: hypothetical protein [unclassified Bradyrhizobium]